ncbi:MAG: glycosyltransferase [Candidatus Omnitrophica bacterium]|nr:glycosyltransferase [Candidatus Omnitrophota bacterium]
MSDHFKVGIVIPNYGRLEYLKEAVDSVLGQSYENFELLISDDHSPDPAIGTYLSQIKDPRVKWVINRTNVGTTKNYDQGVRMLGKDITWALILDNDDVLDKDYIQAMVQAHIQNRQAKVICGHQIFVNAHKQMIKKDGGYPEHETAQDYLLLRCRGQRDLRSSNVFFDLKRFFEVGGYPPFDSGMGTDTVLIFALAFDNQVGFAPAARIYIRVHEEAESMTTDHLWEKLLSMKQMQDYCLGVYNHHPPYFSQHKRQVLAALRQHVKLQGSALLVKRYREIVSTLPAGVARKTLQEMLQRCRKEKIKVSWQFLMLAGFFNILGVHVEELLAYQFLRRCKNIFIFKVTLRCAYVLLTHCCMVCCSLIDKRSGGVLLLRLDALGDFILWLDTAKEYRNLYPGRKITLIVNEAWLELAELLPYWDEVWGLDIRKFRRHMFYRMSFLRQVRRKGFEIVIQPRFSREFLLEDSIVLSSSAKQRIGFAGDGTNLSQEEKACSDRWYTRLVPNPPFSWGELRRNAEFIRALGLTSFKADVPTLAVALDKSVAMQEKYYVISPGAGKGFRRWPLEYFGRIADKIYDATGMKGIICGGAGEGELALRLLHLSKAPLMDMTGKTSLRALAGIIQRASFVLSNETAAIHIAAAVGTKAICILGGGHFGRFVPYQIEAEHTHPLPRPVFHEMDCYGCNWFCKFSVRPGDPVPCIGNVTVEQVWQTIKAEQCV